MAEYYKLAVLPDRNSYFLGTKHAAKGALMLLLNETDVEKDVVLYGDETHAFLEERYEGDEEFNRVDFSDVSLDKVALLENIELSRAEFEQIFEDYGGKVVSVKAFLDGIDSLLSKNEQ